MSNPHGTGRDPSKLAPSRVFADHGFSLALSPTTPRLSSDAHLTGVECICDGNRMAVEWQCSKPSVRGSALVVAPTTPWSTQRQTDATNSAGDLTIPPRVCRNPFAFKALTSSGLRGPLASGTDAPQGETSGYGRLVKPHCPGSPSTEVYRNHTPRGWHRECAWGEWGMRSEHFRSSGKAGTGCLVGAPSPRSSSHTTRNSDAI